jgi:hypothetical protein
MVVKQVLVFEQQRLVPEAVSVQARLLVQLRLVQAVVSLARQRLARLVVVLLEQEQLRQLFRLIQDVLPLQQLYQLRHRSQEEFQQQVKEFPYQPCQ